MGGDLGGAREVRAPASNLSRALCEELTFLSMCIQCNCNVTIKTIPFTGCLLFQTTKPRKVEAHTAVCLPSAGSLITITASMLLGQSLFSKNPVMSRVYGSMSLALPNNNGGVEFEIVSQWRCPCRCRTRPILTLRARSSSPCSFWIWAGHSSERVA